MKNNLLNSDMSHLHLDHQSECLFSFDKVSTAIRNYGRHAQRAIKNVPNIVSLSHCLEQLYSCILTAI